MATVSPFLRLPFVLVNTLMVHISVTPPNRPPDKDERKRYLDEKTRDSLSAVLPWYLPTFLLLMHGLNFSEIYITIATVYPPIRFPLILSILSPIHSIGNISSRLQLTPSLVIGTALCSLGGLLRLSCYRHLGRQFTFELAVRKGHKLITDGPYAIVRHPSYLGSILCFTGLLLSQFSGGSWWAEGQLWETTLGKVIGIWWLAYVVFLLFSMAVIRVPREDEVLRKEFGSQWVAWAKRTPYKLIPGIY